MFKESSSDFFRNVECLNLEKIDFMCAAIKLPLHILWLEAPVAVFTTVVKLDVDFGCNLWAKLG